MKISRFIFNPFGENTFIVWDPDTRNAAIIDPGMYDAREEEAIDSFIERNNLNLKYLIYTHLHIDHSFGTKHIRTRYGIDPSGHPADQFLGDSRQAQAQMFHIPRHLDNIKIEHELREGDVIELGPQSRLEVLEVPGHSPGSIALYSPADSVVFTGDALFPSSVGRTDIPGGDHATLIKSIREKLLPLPDDTVVLAGHCDETTIGRERKHNPYLR